MMTPTVPRLIVLIALLLIVTAASAQSSNSNLTATITWTAPTERENGEPLAPGDLASFKLYRVVDGKPIASATYAGTATSAQLSLAPASCYELQMTAVDTQGLESLPSDSVTACTYGPKAPVNFKLNRK